MLIKNLNIKQKSNNIYSVAIALCCDPEEYYTTKKEAIKRAKELNKILGDEIEVTKLYWSTEEQEYICKYNSNGGLIEESIILTI